MNKDQWPVEVLERCGQLQSSLKGPFRDLLREHQLPDDFFPVLGQTFLPLAVWLLNRFKRSNPLVIGISGGQGTGKSTLADVWQRIYQEMGYRCCTLSLDDIYLTMEQRRDLAAKIHPLLETRGVPGTHDIDLGINTLKALCSAGKDSAITLPRFDKGCDDRIAERLWPVSKGEMDIVLFEGWCLGAKPSFASEVPLNEMEYREDLSGEWRNYVNQQLAGAYQDLFSLIDVWVMLKAPSMQCIVEWRKLQEHKLRARSGMGMTDQQVMRFVQHYERVTRNLLKDMPSWADCVIELGEDHQVKDVKLRAERSR
ncbi:kinase [Microbulbifer sp. A4B17]|uniref:kinase n=1 Tax=Microbulbifer sp. A4B17 TaxID=359370 RepID=UPI000D52A957|nr:kinase [Microbulbifer sp. A4B17]AWF79914.1 kinase [Microbulbifer sp. A4B17]